MCYVILFLHNSPGKECYHPRIILVTLDVTDAETEAD